MTYANGAPGVDITENDESFYVRGVDSSIPGFIGVAEWGPVDTPTLITSWPEFERTFGSYLSSYYLAYSVKQFFDEGGGSCYVTRITARTAGATNGVASSVTLQTVGGGATKARETGNVAGRLWGGVRTWQFGVGNKLSFKVDGAGKVTASITGAAASKKTGAGDFAVLAGQTILYRVGPATEPERTITISAALGLAPGPGVAGKMRLNLGTGLDCWFETDGVGTVAPTIQTVADAGGAPTLSGAGTDALVIHYKSGDAASTVAAIKALFAGGIATAGSEKVYASGGTDATILTAPGDTSGATALKTTPQTILENVADQAVGLHAAITDSGTKVQFVTDQKGTGARLEFTGGSALAALTLSVETLAGSGTVADLDHVTASELDTLANAADSGVTFGVNGSNYPYLERDTAGLTKTIQIVTDDGDETAGAAVLGFTTTLRAGTSNTPINTLTIEGKYVGTRGDDIAITTAAATVNSSTRGKLTVLVDGAAVETYDEYSLDPTDSRYIVSLVADSAWITVTDEDAFSTTASYVTALPAVASATPLTGGNDGLAGLAASDYLGSQTYQTGVYAFDANESITQLAIPGLVDRPTVVSVLAYCAARLDLLAVLDCPNVTPSVAKNYRLSTGAYAGGSPFDTTYGALYYPWIKVSDPIGTTSTTRYIPPSGAVCAAMARADRTGEWKAPAGPGEGKVATALGLSQTFSEATLGDLYLNQINCIKTTSRGVEIFGQKTLQTVPSDYSEVKIRRGAIAMRRSLKPVVEVAAQFEPNDSITWTRTRRAVEPYLDDLRDRARAFSAYRLICDETTNTASVRTQRRMIVRIFVKYTPTAEYVEVPITNVGQGVDLTAVTQ